MTRTRGLGSILRGPPEEAAPHLLGALLLSRVDGSEVVARISEVEAYKGDDDPASHAYRGETERNSAMFRKPGTLYVYRSYGVHNCANSAAGPEGVGWGILIRGAQIVEGGGVAARRRGRRTELADGPGKLCQALGITLEHNGTDLLDSSSPLHLSPGEPPEYVMATPRIGISKAKDRMWRFVAAAQLSA
ncbi:MAG: DNA-3-methyladenine glycosylase [Acidimicrobiia bacterium]|jgi:DNA-3-methyladenine glycosylase